MSAVRAVVHRRLRVDAYKVLLAWLAATDVPPHSARRGPLDANKKANVCVFCDAADRRVFEALLDRAAGMDLEDVRMWLGRMESGGDVTPYV